MRNNFVTWMMLECPPRQLQCILDKLLAITGEAEDGELTLTLNGQSVVIDLAGAIETVEASIDNDTELTVTVNGVDSTPLDLTSVVQEAETVTTLNSLSVVAGNWQISYTNESGTPALITAPFIPTFTTGTRPASGTPGQIIFVSNAVASDASTGSLQMWQPSTSTWKNITIA